MKLIYPAVFKPFTDQSGGYVVEFPDLPGCVTEGKDLEQAIEMGIDAASGWILYHRTFIWRWMEIETETHIGTLDFTP